MEKFITVIDDNLFFTSLVESQLSKAGIPHQIINSLDRADLSAIAQESQIAIINLQANKFDPLALVLQLKKHSPLKILAFCGHGQTSLIERGRKAGCDWVIPNRVAAKKLAIFLRQQKLVAEAVTT